MIHIGQDESVNALRHVPIKHDAYKLKTRYLSNPGQRYLAPSISEASTGNSRSYCDSRENISQVSCIQGSETIS